MNNAQRESIVATVEARMRSFEAAERDRDAERSCTLLPCLTFTVTVQCRMSCPIRLISNRPFQSGKPREQGFASDHPLIPEMYKLQGQTGLSVPPIATPELPGQSC